MIVGMIAYELLSAKCCVNYVYLSMIFSTLLQSLLSLYHPDPASNGQADRVIQSLSYLWETG